MVVFHYEVALQDAFACTGEEIGSVGFFYFGGVYSLSCSQCCCDGVVVVGEWVYCFSLPATCCVTDVLLHVADVPAACAVVV